VIVFSRTGATTELLRTVSHIKQTTKAKILSVTLTKSNALADHSDLSINLPWAYDESVCQTRSVTNLFTVGLLLDAIRGQDDGLMADISSAIDRNEQFKLDHRAALETIGRKNFSNVVVLADGPLAGMAEEGALAFIEIALVSGRFANLLDYRHGPIVINDKGTLTIVAVQSDEDKYQPPMIADLKSRGSVVVTVGESDGNPFDADLHIGTGVVGNFAVMGIYLAYVCQMIALTQAIENGINPDQPHGLDLFISMD